MAPTEPRRTMADTLRVVADLIDAHPDVPLPYVSAYDSTPHKADLHWYLSLSHRASGRADQKAKAAAIVSGLGGKWDKDFGGEDARFTQTRDGLSLLVLVKRDAICERRVVGTETVTLPAVEAQPGRTVEREIVEWDCQPVLAAAVS